MIWLQLNLNVQSCGARLLSMAIAYFQCHGLMPFTLSFRFVREEAEKTPGFTTELWTGHKPETEEYGISSAVYVARRPFHPKRLYSAIYTDESSLPSSRPIQSRTLGSSQPTSGNLGDTVQKTSNMKVIGTGSFLNRVLRSKGFFHLAHEPDAVLEWSTAGRSVSFGLIGQWLSSMMPRELWPVKENPDWDSTWGDR